MRIALMQPYLFPYLGYLALVAATDRFVVLDHVQYVRRGWMHRNRFGDGDGWRWAGLRVEKAPRETPITEIRLRDDPFADVLAAVERYRGTARHADAAIDLVRAAADAASSSFVDSVVESLVLTCELLGLPLGSEPTRSSALALAKPPDSGPEGWALATCARLGAATYVNAPGGRTLYPPDAFRAAGLGLAFLDHDLPVHDRGEAPWVSGLSVMDAIAHVGPERAAELVGSYRLDVVVPPVAD